MIRSIPAIILAISTIFAAPDRAVKNGDTVEVHYVGTFDDGKVFDSSRKSDKTLSFKVGDQQVIPGFEKAVIGMKVGQLKNVRIPAADAYGEHQQKLVREEQRDTLPKDFPVEVGAQLMASKDGQHFIVTVVDVKEKTVTLDANHPMAGKDLNFEIQVVGIS